MFLAIITLVLARYIPLALENVTIVSTKGLVRQAARVFYNLHERYKDLRECQSVYLLEDPLGKLANIPLSFDLREVGLQSPVKDQGRCGSCWAFGTSAAAEAVVMASRTNYTGTPVEPFFGGIVTNVSEQFILNSSRFGVNNFCEGGNFVYALFDLAHGHYDTLEVAEHYPYESSSITRNPNDILQPTPIIPPEAYLNPFLTASVSSLCKANVVHIFQDSRKSFDSNTISVIKSYIARGIPVVGAMYTQSNGLLGSDAFSRYKGGVFHQECTTYGADHQIVFVGYGKYKGTDVWVIRNSWGESWGVYGYAYIPIGRNTMCIEHTAYAAIPQAHTNLRTGDFNFILVDRDSIKALGKKYVRPDEYFDYYDSRLTRGENGLDPDDAIYNGDGTDNAYAPADKKNILYISLITIGVIMGVALIAILIAFCVIRARFHRLARLHRAPTGTLYNITG